MPKNLRNLVAEVGLGTLCMASTFVGRGKIPSADISYPKNLILEVPKTLFA